MAIDKTNLNVFQDQNTSELILKTQLGAPTIKYFNKMLNVKGATTLNLLNTAVKLKPLGCEFTDDNTAKFSQRLIDAKPLESSIKYCLKDFTGTWMQQDLLYKAGLEKLPFADKLAQDLVNGAIADMEMNIWQGDTTTGQYKAFDGIIKIAEAASLASTVTYATGASVSSIVAKIVEAMPEEVFATGQTPCIFMGSKEYDKYCNELVSNGNIIMNMAGWNNIVAPEYITVPGTRNIRVYGVPGLSNTGKFFGSYAENFYYGTDVEDALSSVDMDYEKKSHSYIATIVTIGGVQIAFPELVVEAKEA